MRNQEGKIELQKKVHARICVRDITFLAARPPFMVISSCFFHQLPPFCLVQFYEKKQITPKNEKWWEGEEADSPLPPVSTALIFSYASR